MLNLYAKKKKRNTSDRDKPKYMQGEKVSKD